jgi:hypothetical protein
MKRFPLLPLALLAVAACQDTPRLMAPDDVSAPITLDMVPSVTMVSLDGPFGPGTLTLDPATGLEWLDVTLSTQYSYDELLPELAPGGVFEGYRLATVDEVLTFWSDAGINVGPGYLGYFTPENLQPILDLMVFVGVTGVNTGNLGSGNFFDFTAGHIESDPANNEGWVQVATLSADPEPTATGRPDLGTVPSNNEQDQHGAWLVLDNSPPDVSQAYADPAVLWPPNSKMVEISILGVVDPDGDTFTITVTGVTDDDTNDPTDHGALGSSTVTLRAERSGQQARTYTVTFEATDEHGATSTGSVSVTVPHDMHGGHHH